MQDRITNFHNFMDISFQMTFKLKYMTMHINYTEDFKENPHPNI